MEHQTKVVMEGKMENKNEQEEKEILQKIYKYLTDAGYMRANFTGISPFDRIAGGLTWCITGSDNLNNIGFLFGYGEELNIKRKILLSERIISALLRATKRCPIILQPHQIMGLDVDKLIIVVEWLINQHYKFGKSSKDHTETLISLKQEESIQLVLTNIVSVLEQYQPARRRRPKDPTVSTESYKRLNHQYVYVNYKKTKNNKHVLDERNNFIDQESIYIYPVDLSKLHLNQISDNEERENHYRLLREELDFMSESEQMSVELSKLESYSKISETLKMENTKLIQIIDMDLVQLNDVKAANIKYETELSKMNAHIGEQEDYQQVFNLVLQTKSIRDEFSNLRTKYIEKQSQVQRDKINAVEESLEENPNYVAELNEKIRTWERCLAEEDEEIKELELLLDQPGPAELAMYQRRFYELYNQIAANTIETKQFYDFYNTLIDSKQYVEKEINLLNSVLDNYSRAMSSANYRDQFFKQLETIVEWVNQTKTKLTHIQNTKKDLRHSLHQQLSSLVELEREYASVVSQLNSEASPEKRLRDMFDY